jgi:glycosyltransferase involved in cell wall biosynthesis
LANLTVVFLIGGLDAGGSERQLLYLCRSFVNMGKVKPLVINWAGGENDFFYSEFINSKIEVLCLGGISNKINRIFKVREILEKTKPIVLHSFSFYLNSISRFCCIGTSTKSYGSLRSSFYLLKESSSKFSIFFNIYFGGNLVTNSYSAKIELQQVFWFKLKKVSVLINHMPIPSKTKFSSLPNVNLNSNFKSISVGRCDQNKRIDTIINVIWKLRMEGVAITHIHLGSGILIQELINKVKELGIEENFQFLGSVDNVEEFMVNSDFLIHAAETEGSPNVVIEAMSLGLVVIATECGDLPWIINNYVDGIMIQNTALIDSFYRAIFKLTHDEKVRADIGRCAINKIKFSFDAANYSNNALNLYNSNNQTY